MTRLLRSAGLCGLMLCLAMGRLQGTSVRAQDREHSVSDLIDKLTPQQRVGQLFLVPFFGSDVGDGTAAARLIDGGVGGVILSPARGNFTNTADAPTQAAHLANALQARADAGEGPFVPLFIALGQAGDGYPDSALWGGMTSLPSQMALGATWQPEYAEQVGEVVGRELAAVGVNLLLGPSLDVLNVPRPGSSGDLGVRSFGGTPPWVALFGRAYIEGVHRGSGGRVATAAGDFPGIGGADRSLAEELPVVESTLEQLAAVELVPFVAAADGGSRAEAVSDAFVVSHVRYRGVQQQTDRPLSLDSGGLRYLWAQIPELSSWRNEGGGVLVSAGLGLPAVRRYTDPDLSSFNTRRVIGEALAAGNDVLTTTGFGPEDDPEGQMAEIEASIQWLTGAYEEDETVREMVNAALHRVLTLKRRLYGSADVADVSVDAEAAAAQVGLGGEETARVAREALTLVTAAGAAPGGHGGTSPEAGQRILLVVDARAVRECDTCAAYVLLDPQRILAGVRRAYGPEGTGRIRQDSDVATVTFRELKAWLQAQGAVAAEDTPALVPPLAAERLSTVGSLVGRADWIVFAMSDLRPAEAPGSDALKLFLKASLPVAANRRLVAIAFGAPYYLDTTEIAKLTAYYAVYSRTDPFVDVAIRALFGDEPATGASPVTIPGAGYDLAARLEPALDQSVIVQLVGRDPGRALAMGSTFRVRTSLIRDANGHVVPDGTRVTFQRYDRDEGVYLPNVPAKTVGGRAPAAMRAERSGELAITAGLDNGLRSEELVVRIESSGAAIGDLALPRVPFPAAVVRPRVPVDWGILLLSLGTIILAGATVYMVDADAARSPTRLLRLFLLSLAWGLAGYLLVAAGGLQLAALPGGARLWPDDWNVVYQAPLASFVLALMPVVPLLARALARHWRSVTGTQAPPTPD